MGLRWLRTAAGWALVGLVASACQGAGHPMSSRSGGAGGAPPSSGGAGGRAVAAGGAAGTGTGGQASSSGGAAGGSIIPVADHWPTDVLAMFRGPAMAAMGAEAAVAYVGSNTHDATGVAELRVQRIDAQGVRKGPPIATTNTGGEPSPPSIASDEKGYLVCWEATGRIECLSLTTGQDALVPVFAGAGFTPVVVHGSSGWLLAWRTAKQAPTTIVLQRLGAEFDAVGTAVSFPSTATAPTDRGPTFAIAATESGYVFVTGDPMRAQRLDSALQVLGAPIDLATSSFWCFRSLAATDTAIAFGLGQPYSAKLSFVNATNQVTTVTLPGGVKEGMPVGLLADQGTLAGLWAVRSDSTQTGWHFQHPLDQAPAPTTGGGSLQSWTFDGNLVLARVGGGFLAALAQTAAEIEVLRLGP